MPTARASPSSLTRGLIKRQFVSDASGDSWRLLLKTWSNAASAPSGSELKPTFVLEHTAPFVQKHGARAGDSLLLCASEAALVSSQAG